MSLLVEIEGTDINTGSTLDRIVKNSISIKRDYKKKRSLSASLYYSAADTFPREGQDIVVADSIVEFGGVIKSVSVSPWTPGIGTNADCILTITSDGYNSIPQRRTVSVAYSATTAGAIVTDMITSFLTDEGVTAGTIGTGATITDGYVFTAKSVKEILDDMADMSGYVWNINDSKVLSFEEEATVTTSTETIVEGDGLHFGFKATRSLGTFRNKQYVEGADGILVSVEDSADIAARVISEGNSGVYGNIYRDTNIDNITDATAAATELLYRYKSPASAVVSAWKDTVEYTEGEMVPITYPKYEIATATTYLATSKTMKREGHQWKCTYTLEERDTTEYSGKLKDNAIDFFANLSKGTTLTNVISSGGSSNLYIGEELPTDAEENTAAIDTNDYTNGDTQKHTAHATIDLLDGYTIYASGAITLTLPDIATLIAGTDALIVNGSITVRVYNRGGAIVSITSVSGTDTFDGSTTYTVAATTKMVTLNLHRDDVDWAVG